MLIVYFVACCTSDGALISSNLAIVEHRSTPRIPFSPRMSNSASNIEHMPPPDPTALVSTRAVEPNGRRRDHMRKAPMVGVLFAVECKAHADNPKMDRGKWAGL